MSYYKYKYKPKKVLILPRGRYELISLEEYIQRMYPDADQHSKNVYIRNTWNRKQKQELPYILPNVEMMTKVGRDFALLVTQMEDKKLPKETKRGRPKIQNKDN